MASTIRVDQPADAVAAFRSFGKALPHAGSAEHAVFSQLLLISPQVAAEWLASLRYPRQRTFYPRSASVYSAIMQRGEWTISTLVIAEYVGPDTDEMKTGDRFLMNGYHRLEALVMADATLAFVVELHRMRSVDDIHALYSAQDRGRSRSITDVFRSMALADELGWKEHELRTVAEGWGLIVHNFGPYSRTALADPYERADFVRDWKREGADWIDILNARHSPLRSYLKASPITSVALVTLRHQREKALGFWLDVSRNDGLRAGTPEHALVNWILANRVRSMRTQEYARYIAIAWNAFFRERGLVKMALRDPDASFRLLGTPFNGVPDGVTAIKGTPDPVPPPDDEEGADDE